MNSMAGNLELWTPITSTFYFWYQRAQRGASSSKYYLHLQKHIKKISTFKNWKF